MNIVKYSSFSDYVNNIIKFDEVNLPILQDDKFNSNFNFASEVVSADITIEKDNHNSDIITNSCIISIGNDECKWISLLHAKLTKQNLYFSENIYEAVELMEKESKDKKYFTFVTTANYIKTEEIAYFSECKNSVLKKGKEIFFSFLVHKTVAQLSEFVVRLKIYTQYKTGKTVHIDRVNINNSDANNTIEGQYNFYNSRVNDIKDSFIEETLEIFSFIGHGRDEFVWLQDGIICGKSANIRTNYEFTNQSMPSCYYTGKCYKTDLNILPGYEIDAKHIFMNSCFSGLLDDSSYGLEYNIMYSLLEKNTMSYLGSTCAVDGKSFLNYYYLSQIKSGIPLGIAASNVNDALNNFKLGHTWSYYLVGECAYALDTLYETKQINLHELNSEKIDDITHYTIDVENPFGVISLKFDNSKILEEYIDFSTRIEVTSNIKQEIYGIFRRSGDLYILDIFTDGAINPSEIKIKIKEAVPFYPKIIEYLKQVNTFGVFFGKQFESLLKETSDIIHKFSKNYKYELPVLSNNKKLYRKLSNIEERISKLNNMILSRLQELISEKSFSLEETLLENGVRFNNNNHRTNEKCPNCNKDICINEYSHEFLLDTTWFYYCCPKCGVVELSQKRDNTLNCYFEGASSVKKEAQIINNLVIKNNSSKNIKVDFCFAITRSKDNNIEFDSQSKTILIPANGSIHYPLSIRASELTVPHVYWLKSVILVDGKLTSIKKDVFITH
ncbi:hypothetical protein ACQKOF_02935 [Lysinibacillus sp. NPDC093190]|uniref:hypothetical protein n=1 Tax=Lysinibacillus sp. NPDC093190 TaxID=3390575 RepID=UPI003D072131